MPPTNAPKTGFFSRSSGARSFLRYGYGDLLPKIAVIKSCIASGPARNGCCSGAIPKWPPPTGVCPVFAAATGVEIYEPLFFKGRKGSGLPGGRDAYADVTLKPALDFEKYDYTYRVWGRNLYNPDGDADGWQRLLRRQFGRGAEPAERALASASRILPLVTDGALPVRSQQSLLAGDVHEHRHRGRNEPATLQRHPRTRAASALSARWTLNFFRALTSSPMN